MNQGSVGRDLVLREVLVFSPGVAVFRPADYPWLAELRVVLRGGDGGAGPGGEPGGSGETVSAVLSPDQLGQETPIKVWNGYARPGDPAGQGGYCLLELYGEADGNHGGS